MKQENTQPKKKKWYFTKKAFALYIVIFVVFMIILGGEEQPTTQQPKPTTSSQPQVEQQAPPVEITIDKLVAEYDANKLAAEKKYKDKNLKISGGVIQNISEDIFGKPFISLEPQREFYFGTSIRCEFKDEDSDKLLALQNGQKLAVTGRNEGMTIGIIGLENCDFEE